MAIYITRIRFTYLIASQDIVQQCDGWTSGRGGRRCLWIFGATDSPRSVKLSYHLCPRVLTAGFSSVATTYSQYFVCSPAWWSIKLCKWLTVRCCQLSWSSCSYALQQSVIAVDLLSKCLTVSFVLRAQCNRYLVRLATDPTHDPLFLNCPSPIVFSFPEFHFVDFHCQIFPADFARWMTNQCLQLNFPKVC